ncbi:Crossover junction endonuclease MUS81 [Oopsacas minuta]|uniref:Crossover junction endonuclease MUS81 n=1 Tax=Oopsacas minuta TaxID=111878 RepID=A0AAV7K465_9METZ|nr:Crossover junction endonuclease MUS81 [Oopsacas minuta]
MTDNSKSKHRASDIGYRPRNRSGGYAILIGLLEGEQKGLQEMRKKDIISKAQYHSDTSFIVTNNIFYNAWSTMSILIKKLLVISSGHPVKYSLTSIGRKLAVQFQNQIELVQAASYDTYQSQNLTSLDSDQSSKTTPNVNSNLSDSNVTTERDNTMPIILDSNNNYSDEDSIISCVNLPAITLSPDSYEIVLICDLMEYQILMNSDKRKAKVDMFKNWLDSGIKYESCHLTCGDFIWIARSGPKELILPYIVERKRLDDLSKSIIDKRYQEQKERIISTGLKPIYLIEMSSFKGTLDRDTLMNAIFLTNIRDDFIIQFTRDVFETLRYLVNFTKTLIQLYQGRTLHSKCSESQSQPYDTNLMLFDYFQSRFVKTVPLSLSDMFTKHLMQVPRLTEDEAIAIISEYPTLSNLLDRYKELDEKEGRKLLENIQLNTPNAGRIGPNISTIIYNLYN